MLRILVALASVVSAALAEAQTRDDLVHLRSASLDLLLELDLAGDVTGVLDDPHRFPVQVQQRGIGRLDPDVTLVLAQPVKPARLVFAAVQGAPEIPVFLRLDMFGRAEHGVVLVEDLAKRAGTVAHTVRLHRESVGDFKAEDMVDLGMLEARAEEDRAGLRESLLPPDRALTAMPAVEVTDGAGFRAGQAVPAGAGGETGIVRVYDAGGEFLGVGERSGDGMLAPRRVFNSSEKTP